MRESLGLRWLLPVVMILCGVPIVLRPNVLAYGPAALFPLATAFLYSCYMLVTRRMSQTGGLLTLQFWTGFFAILALLAGLGLSATTLPEMRVYLMPDAREFGLFLLLGLLAGVGHQLIIRALSLIEAGHAAPFQYLEIVSAVTLGWLIFGDFPDLLTWIGAAVIIVSGLFVTR